ncbi:MAG TPA: hypothetical protein VK550_15505 [Polyangiaceae bacterium]|nr:hypothetical protein [Polyangiaceae bacterium]
MVKSSIDTRRALTRGMLAGVAAGILLTLMMTLMSAAGGKDIWYGIKGAAAPFFGQQAMQPGFDALPVLIGLISHLVISAAWGALFALVVEGWSRSTTIIAGVLWAFVVWIGMYYLVLPVVGLSSMQDDAPVGRAIAFHLIFAAALTTAYLVYPTVFGRRAGLSRSAHAV